MGLFNIFSRRKNELEIPRPPADDRMLRFPTPSREPQEKRVKIEKPLPPMRDFPVPKPVFSPLPTPSVHREIIAPVVHSTFIKTSKYKEVLDELSFLDATNQKLHEITNGLESTKNQKSHGFQKIHQDIEYVHNQMAHLEHLIFKKR